MAKRNRYRALEKLMTEVLLGDAFVFILFLLFCPDCFRKSHSYSVILIFVFILRYRITSFMKNIHLDSMKHII